MFRVLIIGSLSLVAAGSGLAASGGRPLSIEDMLSLRRIEAAQISPDGSKVAFVILEPNDKSHSRDPESQVIWLVGTEGGAPSPYTPHPGRAFSPRWSPDSQALAFLSIRAETSGSQIYLMPVDGGEPRKLTSHDAPVATFHWSPDGRSIAYLVPYPRSDLEKDERKKLGYDEIELGPSESLPLRNLNRLWTVNVKTGRAEQVQIGPKHVMDMDWSPDGSRFLLTVADSPYPDDMYLRPRLVTVSSSGGKPTLYCATLGKLRGASWSPDGKSIAFMGSLKGGADFYPGGLFQCSGPGSAPRNLVQESSFSVETFRWGADGRWLLVSVADGAQHYLGRLGLKSGKLTRLTTQPWQLQYRSHYSLSSVGDRIACVLSRYDQPPDLWMVPAAGGARQLTQLNPELENRSYGQTREVRWKARDGLEITGVLIRPVESRPGERFPMIAYIHGSNSTDFIDFQVRAQFLAAHGYAVFLPNYRGSITGGARFQQGNQTDFGGKDFADILDGVQAMLDRGIGDPDRLGVVGESYGGYLSAWTVTQTPRFRAAVMIFGISSWFSLHAGLTMAPESGAKLEWLRAPYEHPERLWDRSPVAHIRNVKTPTLLLWGENDPFIPLSQGHEFFRGLRNYHVPSQLIVYPREGHGLRERNHLEDYYRRILGWFDRYVKAP